LKKRGKKKEKREKKEKEGLFMPVRKPRERGAGNSEKKKRKKKRKADVDGLRIYFPLNGESANEERGKKKERTVVRPFNQTIRGFISLRP